MEENKYCYDYARPMVTTDCVIFGFDKDIIRVLLIQRGLEPFEGSWALPGGFINMDEDLLEGARRELYEETGLGNVYIEQLYTFGKPGRDPRGRVITVAYYALVNIDDTKVVAGDDASRAEWFPLSNLPPLAFDHQDIMKIALQRLKGKIVYQPIGFELLPDKFTLPQLQKLYEAVLETDLDKRNFRKKILSYDLLIALDEKEQNVPHRAARYYKFDKEKYEALSLHGFHFEL